MTEPSSAPAPAPAPAPARKVPFLPAIVLIAAISTCSIYANLSFIVTHKADYRYFPPFRPYVNVNANRHLGGEYFNMAQSLRAGEGFAHPFDRPTGPTAWQPPALPLLLAGLLWVCDGNRDGVVAVVVFLQVYVLIGTGLLVLALVTNAQSASEGRSLAGASGSRLASRLHRFIKGKRNDIITDNTGAPGLLALRALEDRDGGRGDRAAPRIGIARGE